MRSGRNELRFGDEDENGKRRQSYLNHLAHLTWDPGFIASGRVKYE
jgi:hypothetical protein